MVSIQPLLGNNTLNQIAFVVNDIDSTREAFAKLLGIPKPEWFLTAPREISQVVFNGEPSDAQSKLVFINTPSVQIELIEPNPEPSTMREYLDIVGEGIHHISFVVDNLDDKIKILEEMGNQVIQRGNFWNNKGRYAYMDTTSTFKVNIELLEKYDV